MNNIKKKSILFATAACSLVLVFSLTPRAVLAQQVGDHCSDDTQCDSSKHLICDETSFKCVAGPVSGNPPAPSTSAPQPGSGNPPAPTVTAPQPGSGNPPAPSTSTSCPQGTTANSSGLCLPTSNYDNNSIAGAASLSGLILLVIKYLLILVGMIAVVALIIGGFWYITAAGNEEQAEKGRKALINAIIGLIVVILAYAIVNIVVQTLTTTDILNK